MKKIAAFVCVLVCCLHLHAIPAYPHKVAVTIGGETIFIRLYGDEQCKWAETENGYSAVQNQNDVWCYAMMNNEGQLVPSEYSLVMRQDNTDNRFARFLASTPKHLSPAHSQRVLHSRHREVSKKVIGERRILVILMEYTDVKFQKSAADFDMLFNQEGYNSDGAQGSVRDFYEAASYGQLKLSCDIYGPYTTNNQMSYYGNNSVSGNDINAYALFTEAIEHVAKDTDLKQYDGDDDGYLDNVHIIYAGYGEEAGGPASAIWAHESTFGRPYEIGTLKINKYSCAPELRGNSGDGITRIGPHCHEIGHALGAMDYYDTDYTTGGQYEGTGLWDVMASGSWNNNGITPADFNPYVKAYDFGWVSPALLPQGTVSIPPSNTTADSYYILSSSADSDYYLVENRSKGGWGSGLPGEGLLIYHIHKNLQQARNSINATSPQMCYVVCASVNERQPSSSAASYGEINSAGCPFPGTSNNTSFGQQSTPAAFYWESEECGIELNDIRLTPRGDITLTNNSNGTNYKPSEIVSLMFEGFEDNPVISVSNSTIGEWVVTENVDSDYGLITSPRAYEGMYCLQLSAKGSYFDSAESMAEFECPYVVGSGPIQIKGFYTSSGLNGKRSNKLRVSYKIKEEGNWQTTEFQSDANITWNTFTVDVPEGELYSFRIEGVALPGTILALDNLEITQEIISGAETGVMSYKRSTATQYPVCYSPDGRKRQHLQNGLNILQLPDGSFKKLFVRQ